VLSTLAEATRMKQWSHLTCQWINAQKISPLKSIAASTGERKIFNLVYGEPSVRPEVVGSGGHPACRRGRASCRPEQRLKPGGCAVVHTSDPPGRMPRL